MFFSGPSSKVTIGIAGPDISDEAHPGHWNNTVGYHSNGRCYSSHFCEGNTDGQHFGVGNDTVDIQITNEWLSVRWYRYFHEVKDRMFFSTRQSQIEKNI